MPVSDDPRPDFAEQHWRPILGAIVLVGVALRLYGLGRFSIWYDESTSIFALQYVDWDLRFLKAEETRLIPLNTLFLFFWYTVVQAIPGVQMGSQTSDFLLHALPGTFSALTVPLMFAFGRRVTGSAAAGLVAALLTAISPFHMYYASELGPHSLYVILVLLAAYFNFRALEENRLGLWIGTIVFEALSFYAYYFSVFYLAAVNLFVLLNLRAYRAVFVRWIVCQAIAFALVLPAIVLAAFVFRVHASAAVNWFPYPTLKTLVLTVKDWFAGYSPQPEVYWPLFGLGLIAFGLGAWALRDRRRALSFLIIAAFLPPFIQYVFWNTQEFAFYTMRVQLAYSLPAFVLAAAGLTARTWRPVRLGLLALIVVLTIPALADHFAQRIHPVFGHRLAVRYKVDNRGAAAFIREHWREGDVVAHASTVTLGPFLYHYLDAPQVFAVLGPEEWEEHVRNYPDEKVWESLGFLPERIDAFVEDAPRVWLVSAGWEWLEPYIHGNLLREWLDANGIRIAERHTGEVDVYLYDLTPPARYAARMNRVLDQGSYVRMFPAPAVELESRDGGGASVIVGATLALPGNDAHTSLPEARDPSALDVWFEGAADGPNESKFDVHLRNRSENSRTIDVSVRRAAEIYSSLAFGREPESETWRPLYGSEGRVTNVARLSPDAPDAAVRLALPPGPEWDVYVELSGEATASEFIAGDLAVELMQSDGAAQTLATIPGADLEPDYTWSWIPAGRMPAVEAGATLILRATLPAGSDSARIQVGNVALVPAGTVWEAVLEREITLDPMSDLTATLSVPSQESQEMPVVWFEFYDPVYRVHRMLSQHLVVR